MVHLSELADLSLRLLWSKTNCFYPYADVRFQTNISTDEQITLSARFSFDCECSGCGRSGARNFFTSLATTRYTGECEQSRRSSLRNIENAAIDLLRTRHIHSELTLEHEPEDNYSTVHETEVCDALILANKLIKQLKPQQQRILTLRSREECEMAEIANLTGETEDNVRAILSRSRKKLKEMFLKR